MAASHEITPTHWLISGADYYALSKIKDTDGRYLIQPDLTAEGRKVLFGVPVIVTNKLVTGKAALVDFTNVAVVRDLAPSVTVLSERYAEYDEQAIRVVTRYRPRAPAPRGRHGPHRGLIGPSNRGRGIGCHVPMPRATHHQEVNRGRTNTLVEWLGQDTADAALMAQAAQAVTMASAMVDAYCRGAHLAPRSAPGPVWRP